MEPRGLRWWLRFAGFFLLSVSTIMLQVSFTRVFSVALWHHFVWMVVSIALLGYAASGTLLSVLPGLSKGDLDRVLTWLASFFSVSVVFSYVAFNLVPFDPVRLAWDWLQLLYVSVYYLLLSIPFLFSGLALAIGIERSKSRINKLYFSSLFGSALGAVLALPCFSFLTGPGVMVATSVVAGGAALVFSLNLKGRGFLPFLGLLLLLLAITPMAGRLLPMRISPYKGLMLAIRYPDAVIQDTFWNAFSRVDVVKSGLVRYAPGLSLKYQGQIPEQLGVTIDGDSMNAITSFDGNLSSLWFTGFLPTSLSYRLVDDADVLVIGAGGGLDVLTALYHDSDFIRAVESNPLVVKLIRGKYESFSGSIYNDERVKVSVTQGRSFIQSTKEEYDVIVFSMTEGSSTASTGMYSLSENYLYTVESLRSFIDHLSRDGLLTVSRWLLPPPREDIRIVSLAASALESQGVSEPFKHIAVIRSWGTITVLVGKSPLSEGQISTVRDFCGQMGFDVVYIPGVEASEVNRYNQFPEPIYYKLVQEMLSTENRPQFYANYLYDIRPATDDKPFFFHFFKWNRLRETYKSLGSKWQALFEGGYLVPLALVQASALSVVLVLMPLKRFRGAKTKGSWGLLTYFFCLGAGYMFIEMGTIQKLILFLGHPAYSVSTVIFSLLITSGLGSYFSGRLIPNTQGHKLALLAAGVLAPLYGIISPVLLPLLGTPLVTRLMVAVLVISPLGFLLGMPFPLGVRMLNDEYKGLIPWAWAMNGCASVIGSILPTVLALFLGFSTVFLLAGVFYITGFIILLHIQV